jgi:hypothetical protein
MKQKKSSTLQQWIDARKKFHLSHCHAQMARELGMNPKKLGKLANHNQEPWKEPLPNFIESLYYKKFLKSQPHDVKTIEQIFKLQEDKNKKRRKIKKIRKEIGEQVRLLETEGLFAK